ncbi:hypothetical protein [Carboxylicivirga taeanensis]|uniref:hypothetical protein n=1 Tax=Carboxylicivirga taeanensis TaxID=1416875 RepID=UPI003F6DE039
MTFIAGFIAKDNIFLFSDTAITEWNSTKENQISSFGEKSHSDDEKVVYQSEIKLFNTNNGRLILGGAGNANSIDSFIENVESYAGYGLSSREIIKNALENIDRNDFEILLGYFENDKPVFCKKHSNSTKLENCSSEFSYIGMEGTHFSLFQNNFVELKYQTNDFDSWEPKKISVTVNSILQAYGTWNYTLEEGVGGAFTSLYLDNERAFWQPSLGYVLFDINFKSLKAISSNAEMVLPNNLFINSKYIFTDQREGAFYISSPKPNFTGFLFRELDSKKGNFIKEWFDKYEEELIKQFTNLEIEYVVFICTNTKVVTIFEKEELKKQRIQINYGENLKLRYEIQSEDDVNTYAEFLNWITEPLDRDLTLKT